MGAVARKQMEVLRRREAILDASRDILLEAGYHGLTMDRVAEAVAYSKPTVYGHFHCKEEIICALAKKFLEERVGMQERAATFPGGSRERMTAVGEAVDLFMRLHPDEVHLLNIIQTEAILSKSSQEIQMEMKALEFRGLNLMAGIVRDAVAQGDLALPPNFGPEDLCFGIMAVFIGGHAMILRNMPLNEVNIGDALGVLMKTCQTLGDGYGWKPLSHEWDYETTREKVRRQLFPNESRLVYGR